MKYYILVWLNIKGQWWQWRQSWYCDPAGYLDLNKTYAQKKYAEDCEKAKTMYYTIVENDPNAQPPPPKDFTQ